MSKTTLYLFVVFALYILILHSPAQAVLKNGFCLVNFEAKKNSSVEPEVVVTQKINVLITAYSSTPEETDDTPLITASGKKVADGIIANNMLPFGSKIRIPELYGDKVFVVEDRMNRKKSNYHFDVWFPGKQLALNFGVKRAYIEVLEN